MDPAYFPFVGGPIGRALCAGSPSLCLFCAALFCRGLLALIARNQQQLDPKGDDVIDGEQTIEYADVCEHRLRTSTSKRKLQTDSLWEKHPLIPEPSDRGDTTLRWDQYKKFVDGEPHKASSNMADKRALTATNYIRNQRDQMEPFKDFSNTWCCELLGGMMGLYQWTEDQQAYLGFGAVRPYAMMMGPLEHYTTGEAPTGECNGDVYVTRSTMRKMYVQLTDINQETCPWQGIPVRVVGPIALRNLMLQGNQPAMVRTGPNEPLLRHMFSHPTRLLTTTLAEIAEVTGTEIKKMPKKKHVNRAAYVFWLIVALFPDKSPVEQHAMAKIYLTEELDCIGSREEALDWIEGLDMETKEKFNNLAHKHLHFIISKLT